MYTRIVVGTNGSNESHDALALAGRLAAANADVLVVHAFASDPLADSLVLGAPVREAAEELLGRELERAPAGARTLAVGGSSPARVLHRVAEDEHADLLVVGSSRHGAVGRALLGDDARQAVHHAPCSIVVAPRGYAATAPDRIARIGVGFDASPDARAALAAAQRLARELGAELELVAAISAPFDHTATAYAYPYPIDWSDYYEALREQRRAELDETLAPLRSAGLPVTAEIRDGWAAEVLAELSERCDLLVVGSRHWGLANRLLLGSTTAPLLRKAHCPLLVVPRDEEEET